MSDESAHGYRRTTERITLKAYCARVQYCSVSVPPGHYPDFGAPRQCSRILWFEPLLRVACVCSIRVSSQKSSIKTHIRFTSHRSKFDQTMNSTLLPVYIEVYSRLIDYHRPLSASGTKRKSDLRSRNRAQRWCF